MFSAIESIQLAFSLISLPLYILFLTTLIRFQNKPPFNSDFFKLCLNLAIIDILTSTRRWVMYTFVGWGWFGLPYLVVKLPFVAKVAMMMSWVFSLSQALGVLALALNRFTNIVIPLRHELIWTKSFLRLIIILQWLLPALVTSPQSLLSFAYIKDNTTRRLSNGVSWLNHDAQKYYFTGAFVFTIFVNITILIMYSIILYNARKNLQENQSSMTMRHDVILAVYGFSVFVFAFLSSIYTFVRAIKVFYSVCVDMSSWCNPWFCLILLAKIRKHMVATLFCSRVNENMITPGVVAIPMQFPGGLHDSV